MAYEKLRKALHESQLKGDMLNEERSFRSEAKKLGVAKSKAVNTRKEGEAMRGLMRQNQATSALKGALEKEGTRSFRGGAGGASSAIGNNYGKGAKSNRSVLRKFSEGAGSYSLSAKAKEKRG